MTTEPLYAGIFLIIYGLLSYKKDDRVEKVFKAIEKQIFQYTDDSLKYLKCLKGRNTGAFTGESSIVYTYLRLFRMTKEYKYLDDSQYLTAFVNTNKSKYGVRKLREKLKQKGVADANLSVLDDYEEDVDALKKVAEKYMSHKEKTPENYNKLYRFLAMRGYNFDDINACVNEIKRSE